MIGGTYCLTPVTGHIGHLSRMDFQSVVLDIKNFGKNKLDGLFTGLGENSCMALCQVQGSWKCLPQESFQGDNLAETRFMEVLFYIKSE